MGSNKFLAFLFILWFFGDEFLPGNNPVPAVAAPVAGVVGAPIVAAPVDVAYRPISRWVVRLRRLLLSIVCVYIVKRKLESISADMYREMYRRRKLMQNIAEAKARAEKLAIYL